MEREDRLHEGASEAAARADAGLELVDGAAGGLLADAVAALRALQRRGGVPTGAQLPQAALLADVLPGSGPLRAAGDAGRRARRRGHGHRAVEASPPADAAVLRLGIRASH